MGPAATRPTPPPAAITADRLLMLGPTSAAVNSSRMMPKDSGNSAPPMPWTTRAMISTPMEGASAASRQPSVTVTRTATRVRFLPTRSPTRPRIGVKTDADSRYAVITQVTVDCEVCIACWTVGRAGAINDWSMENTPAPVARTAKVRRVDFLGMEKPLGTGCGRDRPAVVVRQGGPMGGRERGASARSGRGGTEEGRTGGAGGTGPTARQQGARARRRCVRPHATTGT